MELRELSTLTADQVRAAVASPLTRRPIARVPYAGVVPEGAGREPLVPLPASVGSVPAYDGSRGLTACLPARVRAGVADRLEAAAAALPAPYGLTVLDAWRTRDFQRELSDFYGADATAGGFVASPDDPTRVPPHVTGGTVDLTLDAGAGPLALGSAFDEFSVRGGLLAYEDQPGLARDLRRLLYWAMVGAGFAGYDLEWWHFSYGDARWANWYGQPGPLYGEAYLHRHGLAALEGASEGDLIGVLEVPADGQAGREA